MIAHLYRHQSDLTQILKHSKLLIIHLNRTQSNCCAIHGGFVHEVESSGAEDTTPPGPPLYWADFLVTIFPSFFFNQIPRICMEIYAKIGSHDHNIQSQVLHASHCKVLGPCRIEPPN